MNVAETGVISRTCRVSLFQGLILRQPAGGEGGRRIPDAEELIGESKVYGCVCRGKFPTQLLRLRCVGLPPFTLEYRVLYPLVIPVSASHLPLLRLPANAPVRLPQNLLLQSPTRTPSCFQRPSLNHGPTMLLEILHWERKQTRNYTRGRFV